LFAPTLERLVAGVDPRASVRVLAVRNHFFGGNVSVAGLLTGADIAAALGAEEDQAVYLLPAAIANRDGLLLDDVPCAELGIRSGREVRLISCDARGLLDALRDLAAGSPRT
jgi:hypothetical protein